MIEEKINNIQKLEKWIKMIKIIINSLMIILCSIKLALFLQMKINQIYKFFLYLKTLVSLKRRMLINQVSKS